MCAASLNNERLSNLLFLLFLLGNQFLRRYTADEHTSANPLSGPINLLCIAASVDSLRTYHCNSRSLIVYYLLDESFFDHARTIVEYHNESIEFHISKLKQQHLYTTRIAQLIGGNHSGNNVVITQ